MPRKSTKRASKTKSRRTRRNKNSFLSSTQSLKFSSVMAIASVLFLALALLLARMSSIPLRVGEVFYQDFGQGALQIEILPGSSYRGDTLEVSAVYENGDLFDGFLDAKGATCTLDNFSCTPFELAWTPEFRDGKAEIEIIDNFPEGKFYISVRPRDSEVEYSNEVVFEIRE